MSIESKVYCNMGLLCANSGTCKRILTEEEAKEHEKQGIPVRWTAHLPGCFVSIWEADYKKNQTEETANG